MRKSRKGQSTLEYVIILAAVVGGIIMVAGLLKSNINAGYTTLGNTMQSAVSGAH